MNETNILRLTQLELSKTGARVFRNNTALGWAGKVVIVKNPTKVLLLPGDALVRKAYPIHAGLCEGSSDLIGISPRPFGRFIAAEIKDRHGKLTKKQTNFLSFVRDFGGISFKASSPQEAVAEYYKQL